MTPVVYLFVLWSISGDRPRPVFCTTVCKILSAVADIFRRDTHKGITMWSMNKYNNHGSNGQHQPYIESKIVLCVGCVLNPNCFVLYF